MSPFITFPLERVANVASYYARNAVGERKDWARNLRGIAAEECFRAVRSLGFDLHISQGRW